MGRSITCNFQVQVENSSNGAIACYGAMTLKDVRGILMTEKEYQKTKGNRVTKMYVWPQTSTGQKYMKGKDYFIMDCWGKIDYYNVNEPIPFYTFE